MSIIFCLKLMFNIKMTALYFIFFRRQKAIPEAFVL